MNSLTVTGASSSVSIYNTVFSYNSGVSVALSGNTIASVTIGGSSFSNNQAQPVNIANNINSMTMYNNMFVGNNHNKIGTVALNGDRVDQLNITGCSWTGNNAQAGGAVYVSGVAIAISITNSNVTGTVVTGEGAGFFIFGGASTTTVDNCVFSGNSAQVGAGISFHSISPAVFTITNSQFNDNTSPQGCAISFDSTSPVSTMSMYGVTMYGNNGQRGALYLSNTANSTIYNSLFDSNTGSAIYGELVTGSVNMTSVVFRNNQANQGGSVSLYGTTSSVIISKSNFSESTASTIGADLSIELNVQLLRISGSYFYMSDASLRGGAVSVGATAKIQTFIVENTNMEATSSLFGSGVAVAGLINNMSVNNCIFTNNLAQYEGAAIYTVDKSVQNIDVRNSQFMTNNALSGSGGGIKITGGNTTVIYIYNNLFDGNSASTGAALVLQKSVKSLVVDSCVFRGNYALSGGDLSYLTSYNNVKIIKMNND